MNIAKTLQENIKISLKKWAENENYLTELLQNLSMVKLL